MHLSRPSVHASHLDLMCMVAGLMRCSSSDNSFMAKPCNAGSEITFNRGVGGQSPVQTHLRSVLGSPHRRGMKSSALLRIAS